MKNRYPVQVVALLAGAAFLLVGLLGFVPGITSRYSDLSFAGNQSQAHLLGLFQISVLHNLVHALFGIVGLIAAKTAAGARGFLLGAGAVYLVLTVFGMLIDLDSRLTGTSCLSTPPTTGYTSRSASACSPPASPSAKPIPGPRLPEPVGGPPDFGS